MGKIQILLVQGNRDEATYFSKALTLLDNTGVGIVLSREGALLRIALLRTNLILMGIESLRDSSPHTMLFLPEIRPHSARFSDEADVCISPAIRE